jgi:hypothetical protein
MKFEQEHTLPLLAIEATWAAVQQKSEKLWTLDKLLGKKQKATGPMSKGDMLLEVGKLAEFQDKQKKKKEEEEGGE